jgi:hypothetical protein
MSSFLVIMTRKQVILTVIPGTRTRRIAALRTLSQWREGFWRQIGYKDGSGPVADAAQARIGEATWLLKHNPVAGPEGGESAVISLAERPLAAPGSEPTTESSLEEKEQKGLTLYRPVCIILAWDVHEPQLLRHDNASWKRPTGCSTRTDWHSLARGRGHRDRRGPGEAGRRRGRP